MELKLYDTLAREKRAFLPINRDHVRMYVCGPTVYDLAHIGNARPVIVFDVLFRLLRHLYGGDHVTYVRNITDVDDKINARAAERGIPIRALTEETYANFKADVAALGCLAPTFEPRATEHIGEMKLLIERLVAAGHAYVADDHVLFDVPSMPDYGRLSKRPLDEMVAGARVEVAPYKRDPMDFVLWKPSKPGEPAWELPCGIAAPGRPGWHIECSAMSWKLLGETFDIHGGGIDLVFPHHENEIAQSRCAFHTGVMANYWMHNGFLQVEGEKMSKSLGNFVTIRELLGDFHGTVLRYNMLRSHYRQPIDWRRSESERSRHELWSMANIIRSQEVFEEYNNSPRELIDEEIVQVLADDLNSPMALRRLHALAEAGRHNHNNARIFAATATFMGLRHLDRQHNFVEGFVSEIPDERMSEYLTVRNDLIKFKNYSANGMPDVANCYLATGFSAEPTDHGIIIRFMDATSEPFEDRIARLLADRTAARNAKNFAESDRIRDELLAMGVVLKDSKDGTTWEVAR